MLRLLFAYYDSTIIASACRSKVTTWLFKRLVRKVMHMITFSLNRFKSPKDAESFYNLHQVHSAGSPSSDSSSTSVSTGVQTDDMEAATLLHMFSKLPVGTHLEVLSRLFSSYVSATSSLSVPTDFLCHAAAAMVH